MKLVKKERINKILFKIQILLNNSSFKQGNKVIQQMNKLLLMNDNYDN